MTHARSSYTAGAGIAIGVVLVALSVGTPAAAADLGVDAAESVVSESTTTKGGCVAAVTAAIATGDTSPPTGGLFPHSVALGITRSSGDEC